MCPNLYKKTNLTQIFIVPSFENRTRAGADKHKKTCADQRTRKMRRETTALKRIQRRALESSTRTIIKRSAF